MKNNLSYLLKGISLANKNIKLLTIGVLLSLISVLSNYVQIPFLSLLSFVLAFVEISFWMSLPLFLIKKQDGDTFSIKELLTITLKNTKRLILPVIFLFIIFMVGFLLVFFSLASIHSWTIDQSNAVLDKLWNGKGLSWTFILSGIVLGIINAVMQFSPFFFSLENKGFLSSVKNSFTTAVKHLGYTFFIFVLGFISYMAISSLPISIWTQLIISLFQTYVSFVFVSTTLFYYQTLIKKTL